MIMEKLRHNIMLFAAVFVSVLATSAYAVSPRVIKTVPENGDQNVDPSLRQIQIEFDQDMNQQGYSICGGGPLYPKTIGKPKWINKRTIVMRVTLEPAHEYEMSINCPSYQNCKNTNGEPAEIYPIKFKTSIAGKKSTTSAKSPSLLLQEGLYAEETEGNLDKAIGIYQQVIDEAGEIQRLAAKATYQLGMCYLKKGEKEKAAEYFQQVVSNYSTQKIFVEKAQEQLAKLPASPTEAMMTQEMHNTVDANGLIHFKNPHKYTNIGTEPMTNTSFINSDFVNVTAMYDKTGQPIKFTTTHEGNHFRYNITFDKPILPGETIEGTVEGTITGLIKPVASMPDTYQYYMNHSPSTNVPTLRIEAYLLPKGAEVISTSPDMKKSEKNGRIELSVEKIIPVGGSLLTTFQYKLASAKPLKLESAPWADGEVMELKLKRPTGNEYGTVIYSVQSYGNNWQIISHMYVSQGSISQYTFVEADANSFAPIYGQTTNWMGDFKAEYGKENVKLTIPAADKESTQNISVDKIVYDNEQALYLIRRMPLAESYEGSFPIFTVQGSTTVECRIKVLGAEEISVEAGTFKCYKTDLSIYTGEMKTLDHTLWFSTDEHKYLVKYDVGGAATMELAKVWQRSKDKPIAFENTEPAFSVTMPADWRFYKYGSKLQLLTPDLKAWALLTWQKRGTDPNSASAMTIAKADCEKLRNSFENYTADQTSWKESNINSLEAAQYVANYRESGNSFQKYSKPRDMAEYRTYIVDASNVYWFVFRIEKDKFEQSKTEFDSIINSFKANAK